MEATQWGRSALKQHSAEMELLARSLQKVRLVPKARLALKEPSLAALRGGVAEALVRRAPAEAFRRSAPWVTDAVELDALRAEPGVCQAPVDSVVRSAWVLPTQEVGPASSAQVLASAPPALAPAQAWSAALAWVESRPLELPAARLSDRMLRVPEPLRRQSPLLSSSFLLNHLSCPEYKTRVGWCLMG